MHKIIYGLFFICLTTLSSAIYSAEYYGPTFPNEHLYRIALNVRPTPEATIQQVMIAILHANPNAFNNNNINGLKSGFRLRLPSDNEVMRISPYYALRMVDQQNYQWQKGILIANKKSNKIISHKHKHQAQKISEEADSIPSIANLKLENKTAADTKTSIIDLARQQKSESTTSNLQQQPDQVAPVSSNTTESNAKDNTTINNFMNDTKKFEEEANTQIITLQRQTKALQATVNQLNTELRTLTYHFVQLSTQKTQPNKNYIPLLLSGVKQNMIGLSSAILALVLLSYLLIRSFRPKPVASMSNNRKEEYNFMDSEESIPSKLDLARVYIDMGDFSAAETALHEVIAKGNEEQRKRARDLLGKITSQ